MKTIKIKSAKVNIKDMQGLMFIDEQNKLKGKTKKLIGAALLGVPGKGKTKAMRKLLKKKGKR